MVNTLRITSVVAILVAGVLLVLVLGPKSMIPELLAKFATGGDEEIARILDAPGVVDRFRESQGSRSSNKQEAVPPLVRQAEIFAGILMPPEPVAPPKPIGRDRQPGRPVPKAVPSSAKFNLVGTAYTASDPDSSFAYIRLADDTLQWVRRGDEVGHLTVKEIKDRSIICWDGHSDVEMAVEAAPETASLLETPGAAAALVEVEQEPDPTPVRRPAGGRITGPPTPRPWSPSRPPARPDSGIDPREQERMEELVKRIRESKAANSAESPEERAELMKKLVSEYKSPSSRVSPEEAEDVEDLGRELNESQKLPPNQKRTNLRRRLNIPRRPGK